MSDGREIEFAIDEQMWEQWGETRPYLIQAGTSELLDKMQKAFAIFHLEGPGQD